MTLRFSAVVLALLVVPIAATAAPPQVDYAVHCMGCHRGDGLGSPPDVPSLVTELPLFIGSPQGRAYLIRVPGAANAPLSNEALAALLNWMVERFAGAEAAKSFAAFTVAEVARERRRTLLDVAEERRRLLPKTP